MNTFWFLNKYKTFLTIFVALANIICYAKDTKSIIKVAVIDTGIDSSLMQENFLCKEGHKDFTDTSLADFNGHGTHISGLIDQYVKSITLDKHSIDSLLNKKADYCQVIIKFFDPRSKHNGLDPTIKAFKYAVSLGVHYINYSAGGESYSREEHDAIKKALDAGITVVVAAGNNSVDLVKRPYYPASLDSRLIVVGNLLPSKVRSPTSNFGNIVDVWEVGSKVMSLATKTSTVSMSGTSQAAAIHTGKLIRKRLQSMRTQL